MSTKSSLILGIESSCDETAAALVQDGCRILGEATAHQEEVHRRWGGIVPELASRKHTENLLPVVQLCLERAGKTYQDIDAIAVTNRPGLVGALIVGLNGAKALAYSLGIPLIPINHLEAHLAAILLDHDSDEDRKLSTTEPFLGLIVSGGHTSLYEIKDDFMQWKLLGHTLDDAAGEAFDKGARLLKLPHPGGGPALSQAAQGGNPKAIPFPRSLKQEANLNFSFSGLKTALLYFLQKNPDANTSDVCASYQEAITDMLVNKVQLAVKTYGYQQVILAGGVAANARIRTKLREVLHPSIQLHIPPPQYCTDNGAMVAAMGAVLYNHSVYCQGEEQWQLGPQPRVEKKGPL